MSFYIYFNMHWEGAYENIYKVPWYKTRLHLKYIRIIPWKRIWNFDKHLNPAETCRKSNPVNNPQCQFEVSRQLRQTIKADMVSRFQPKYARNMLAEPSKCTNSKGRSFHGMKLAHFHPNFAKVVSLSFLKYRVKPLWIQLFCRVLSCNRMKFCMLLSKSSP